MIDRSLSLPILFLAGLLALTCGQSADSKAQAQAQANDESRHKSVQVDWQGQLKSVQKQLEHEPNSPFLHGQAAVAYDALGDFDNFEREIQSAIKLDPKNPMTRYMAYAVYKRRHLEQKQSEALSAALSIDPVNPFGHYEKAATLEDSKDLRGALKEYETAQRLLEELKSKRANFQGERWWYTDPCRNPYDVTEQQSRVGDDLSRVRKAIKDGE